MAVKFTTMIKMDMNRDEEIEKFLEGQCGYFEEEFTIWDYHLEIPCKLDEKENKAFIQAMSQKFSEEESDYKISVKNEKNYFSVTSSWNDCYETIEELYNVSKLYTECLEEILEEHGVQECTLILELCSDMALYPFD